MDSSGSNQAPSLVERAKGIILSPKTEWVRIAGEDTTTKEVATGYVIPLMLIGPACGIIGSILFGGAYAGIYAPSPVRAVVGAVVAFVLALISFYLLTILAHVLAPRFGATEGESRSFKLVAYSLTPSLLIGLLTLWPALWPLQVLAFYGIYLIYLGATPMLGIPQDKAMPYTVVLVVCAFVLNIIVGALTAAHVLLVGAMGLMG
jgi:hypothetical protein